MILGSGFWYLTAPAPSPAAPTEVGFFAANAANETGPVLHPVERAARQKTADSPGEYQGSFVAPAVSLERLDIPGIESPRLPNNPPPVALGLASLAPAAASRAPEVPALETAPSIVPRSPAPSFAGEWFYAPGIEKPDPHLYPPVDIEFRLMEKGGILDGQYRGRYAVPDAAVPQDVVFQVQGKSAAGQSAALLWTASDGANGEIDLNLRQPNLMKVTWWTTQLGRRPGLSSGSATLLRQQTP
jgi:hypothetical protein